MFDPRQMASMMKQMGIKTRMLDSPRAIFEFNDNSILVIENPEVVEISMQGKVSYQVTGVGKTLSKSELSKLIGNNSIDKTSVANEINNQEQKQLEEDIELVMQGANVSRDKAIYALKQTNGDIARAILLLSEEHDVSETSEK